jgi:hypothetical protein
VLFLCPGLRCQAFVGQTQAEGPDDGWLLEDTLYTSAGQQVMGFQVAGDQAGGVDDRWRGVTADGVGGISAGRGVQG